MIRRLVDFALQNRFLVLAGAMLLFAWGIVSFHRLPVEAYPDVANNYVDVIAQWPGISAEQIEQQVTIPLETVMNGIPGVAHVRSWSIFGLSTVEMVFGEDTTDFENRERVLERLSQVTLPPGVVPQMGTDWSPVGQIYFYTLDSTNPEYDPMNLKSLETWVVEKNLKSVPGVPDTNPFGGPTREYQVRLDPDKLVSYGLSLAQVEQQLTNNNANAGGSFIVGGLQQINVREVGLVRNIQDIENTVILTKNGTALRVKDIAVVQQGPEIRLGQFGKAIRREDGRIEDNDDVVSGIALLQKGADAQPVLEGITDLGVFNVTGQPDLVVTVDRAKAARWQINVADVQDAVQTAVGGNTLTQVLRGEQVYNLTLRYLPKYRDTREAIQNIRLLSPSGERVSLAQLCTIREADEGSEIYRENNQRYVAIKYSVRGRALGDAVKEAIQKVNAQVKLPRGYHIGWEGEYQSEVRAEARMLIIVPLTVLLIFIILYSMYKSIKWALVILATVAMARIGGLLALLVTHTNFSVSSSVGFLALFGVSVQTGVIMLEYINQLRACGHSIEESAVEGAVLRLRPIMMTMLVATLGLLPAAMSHGIGSDSQRPFAIVIVGGLIADLVMSIFLLPTLYVWFAGPNDILPLPETEFEN